MMTGDGMLMIQSKEVIGLEIKMPFIICVSRHLKPFTNYNLMAFHFQEQNRAKFINVPLEDNPNNMEKVNRS